MSKKMKELSIYGGTSLSWLKDAEEVENKKLLLKDLSARLLYKVICEVEFKDSEGWKIQNMSLEGVFINECYFTTDTGSIYSKEFRPYLRPMSSMTEEEKEEYKKLCRTQTVTLPLEIHTRWYDTWESIDWLNKHHFDYRGFN